MISQNVEAPTNKFSFPWKTVLFILVIVAFAVFIWANVMRGKTYKAHLENEKLVKEQLVSGKGQIIVNK